MEICGIQVNISQLHWHYPTEFYPSFFNSEQYLRTSLLGWITKSRGLFCRYVVLRINSMCLSLSDALLSIYDESHICHAFCYVENFLRGSTRYTTPNRKSFTNVWSFQQFPTAQQIPFVIFLFYFSTL